MKLAVVIPWFSPFMWTKAIDGYWNLDRPEGVDVKFFRGSGWCPAKRHINGCELAMKWGADLIMIFGADQIGPPDLLTRLTKHMLNGCDAVGALVPGRGYCNAWDMKPFQPLAWRFKRFEPKLNEPLPKLEYLGWEESGHLCELLQRNTGLQTANLMGSGCIMFPTDTLRMLQKPWFFETVDSQMNRTANMDTWFSWRLQQEGHAMLWVDTDIAIRHLHAFEIDDTYQDRFADWGQPGMGDPELLIRQPNAAPVVQSAHE